MRYLVLAAALLAAGYGAWLAFGRRPPPGPTAADAGRVWFEDVATRAGLAFRHFDPATPDHLMPETMGSGLGWIDYDADGWPDLFCVQGAALPPAAPDPARTHKLHRNNRDGTFADVTAAAGLDRAAFGTGCAVGDFDNDGHDDLLVTALGGLTLFQNVPAPAAPGGRRFADVTAAAGLTDPHWATSAAWADLDGDGLLDLYVCNYVEVDPAKPLVCRNPEKGATIQCSPTMYPFAKHRLFRNRGAGRFEDVTDASGVGAAPLAPGLGVVVADLDGDGRPDIYVANDLHPAYLFRNLGGMRFAEGALPAGAALGPGGKRMAGMGVEAADLDGTGRPSLFVTNYHSLPNVLFRNLGGLRFLDDSFPSGLGGPSVSKLGFGTAALDADGDGRMDLAVANGHVQRVAKEVYGVAYAQDAQLFLAEPDRPGTFRDATATAGDDFVRPRVGRGLARADFDHDGLPDLALSGVGEPVALLRNRTDNGRGWVCLELIGDGAKSNRNAVGAVVRVEWAGQARTHVVTGGGSYLSAHDRRLVLGLGDAAKLDRVLVRWPSGAEQEHRDLPARTRWRLREGVAVAESFTPPGR